MYFYFYLCTRQGHLKASATHHSPSRLILPSPSHGRADHTSSISQPVVDPLHGLQERSLFGILGNVLAHIAAHGKAMLHAAVQGDLVGLLGGGQELFSFFALVRGEDLVGFCEAGTSTLV